MPGPDGEGCFRYDYKIPVGEWFYQGPVCEIYWISIAAIYDHPVCGCNGDLDGDDDIDFEDGVVLADCIGGDCSGCINSCDINCDGVVDAPGDTDAYACLFMGGGQECCPGTFQPDNAWGWKTRKPHWNDDAVRIFAPTAPTIGGADFWLRGEPIEQEDGSWDFSFVLTTYEGLQPPRPGPKPRDKNRYLSIYPGNPGVSMAILVKGTSLDGYPLWNGTNTMGR